MTLKEFAQSHRLRIRIDGCGDAVIPGRASTGGGGRIEDRSHVYDFGGGRFGLCLMFATARKFGFSARFLDRAGIAAKQIGDTEGVFLFDPSNKAHVSIALKACGIKRRREASPAQLAALQKARDRQKSAR